VTTAAFTAWQALARRARTLEGRQSALQSKCDLLGKDLGLAGSTCARVLRSHKRKLGAGGAGVEAPGHTDESEEALCLALLRVAEELEGRYKPAV